MSEQQSLDGSPLACGTQYGPYTVASTPVPLYDVPSLQLWGAGRTNMYWRGPAPSSIPAPVLVGVAARTAMAIQLDITGIKGQTPFDYRLLISQNLAGPFVDADANDDQLQTGNFRQFLVRNLAPNTTYYYVAGVRNGFANSFSPVSAPFTTAI